jgi:leader peptidase (prepilin peptidase)/N-methyltransferase
MVAIGLLGAAVGSFLNVVAYRLPRGESLVKPRSRCPSCEAQIGPLDNVPILSWLLLRGRCRSCKARISSRYPLVEALTATVFTAVALVRGVDPRLALELPFAAMLIAIAAIDLERQVIPNKILLPAAIYGVVAGAVVAGGELPELLIAGAAAFTALLLVALVHPAGMGMGDVKLAGVMGLYLGSAVAPALLLAFLAGTLAGLGLILREGPGARKKGVPFGPFLALGGIAALLAGPELVDLYLESFVR